MTIGNANGLFGEYLEVIRPKEINLIQLAVGILCLAAGTLEYLAGRAWGSTYFLALVEDWIVRSPRMPSPYGSWGYFAPDFFHPLGFALISMAVAPKTRWWRVGICLAWFMIDGLFELAQKNGYLISTYLPSWLQKIPVLDQVQVYLEQGTYDFGDMVAIAAGSLAAMLIGELSKGRGTERDILHAN